MAGAVILAAGGSKCFGRAKQLEPFAGRPLVRIAALAAIGGGCEPVVVVTGSETAEIEAALAGLMLIVALHPGWSRGIGGSIRAGLTILLQHVPATIALVVMASDQPFVSAEIIASLVDRIAPPDRTIAACRYANTLGVPACFHHKWFSHLSTLEDSAGAKQIIHSHPAEVATIDFPEGAQDIDTPADLASLESHYLRGRTRSLGTHSSSAAV